MSAVTEDVGQASAAWEPATAGSPSQPERQSDRRHEGYGRGARAALDGDGMARALGWFSVGLGLAELAAPRQVANLIGVGGNPALLRALGLREIASGIGILTQERPAGWMWSRVGGGLMDLALLGAALRSSDARRGRVAAAGAAVLGVTVLDVLCSQQLTRAPGRAAGTMRVQRAVTINRPAEECYAFWRDVENLPRFMANIEEVRAIDERRSHWMAKAPAGTRVAWDSEIVTDRRPEEIAWRTLPGADVENRGRVRFETAPGGRGTTVRVELEYRPPGGMTGALAARMFGREPGQQAQEDLRRFKQVMETGEVVTTEGQPAGRRSTAYRMLRQGRQS